MGRRKSRNLKQWVPKKTPAPAPAASSSAPPPPSIELARDVTANRKSRIRKQWVPKKTPAAAPAASSSPPSPPWIELPGDVTANILQRLGAVGMLRSAQRVCSTWWKVCKDPAMWRVIVLHYPRMIDTYTAMSMCRPEVDWNQRQLVDLAIDPFGNDELLNYVADRYDEMSQMDFTAMCRRAVDQSVEQFVDLTIDSLGKGKLMNNVANRYRKISNEDYTAMCRHAVDRSQGQLVDLTIEYFGDGELINYIADRSRNLKRLKLVFCHQMSGGPLVQAIEKFEQLEELHLTMLPWISPHQIEAIGNSCPKLKSFSYNERGSKYPHPPDLEDDDDDDDIIEGFDRNVTARAIGKCMPNLHHLQLFAHEEMQNEGLEAILDGCPRLESLDIRQCFGLDLRGDLGKRCREQIKDLRLPNDSISDASWLVEEPSESDYECYGDYDYCNYYEDLDYESYDDFTNPLGYESFNDDFSPLGYGFFNDDGPGIFDYDFF
ncbi:F-box protein SKIP19-like isoform X2 [Salvia miltiorrhiza]|uniref:F-box protein SKIP19-like isoform X2 n=1 Tax=Salvia miltiorrhiza TaxID=226208 RepID=UPI0025AD142B|nr:F-box protein SKIP19-like isoform X2 [Salvia miltiorrhiza]